MRARPERIEILDGEEKDGKAVIVSRLISKKEQYKRKVKHVSRQEIEEVAQRDPYREK